jgi:hypothetical protein
MPREVKISLNFVHKEKAVVLNIILQIIQNLPF